MDGGTSLDLQVDTAFTEPARSASRPPRAPMPAGSTSLPSKPAPAPAPAASTSMAIVPSRAAAAAKEEAILTARELAAAFQLDFKPPASARSGKGGVFRTLVAVLLIAIVAVAIVMAIRPDVREKSVAWLDKTWASIRSSLEQPSTKTTTIPPGKTKNEPPKLEQPKTGTVVKVPETKPIEPRIDPRPDPKPEVKPEPRPEPPAVVEVKPSPVVPEPRPVTPAPPAVSIDPVDPNLNIAQATTLASQLRGKALDAEFEGRWGDALALYERIIQLPKEAWPADINIRIDRARRHAQ
jgi:hypothetical protein